MTHTKYQKYVFGLKSSHLKIGANGAGVYTIPQSVSYTSLNKPIQDGGDADAPLCPNWLTDILTDGRTD